MSPSQQQKTIPKSSHSQTWKFQFRTLWLGLFLLLASSVSAQQGAVGLLVYASETKWQGTAVTLAHQLEQYCKQRSIRLELVSPAWEHKTRVSKGLRPESAPEALKIAWEQYFQLKLRQALESVIAVKQGQIGKEVRLAATVLETLIQQARGQRGTVRRLMQQIRNDWPVFELPSDVYPPAFIKLFKGPHRRDSPPSLQPEQALKSIRSAALAYARQNDWNTIWAIRVSSIGWNGQAELLRFAQTRSARGRPVIIEFERGASLRKIAEQLGEKIFEH